MELILSEQERTVLDGLLEMPPRFDRTLCSSMPKKSINKIALAFTENCMHEYGDHRNREDGNGILHGIVPGLHSTYLYDVIKFLLEFGLEPNFTIDDDVYCDNLLRGLLFVDNELVAADTMALLMEHGGDPNLIVDGESIFEHIDFEIWFGSIEQELRFRYDAWVHIWMVLVGYGGEIRNKGPMVTVFKDYLTGKTFDLRELRNHRRFYYGLSIEDDERALHIFDKDTLWKVAQW